MSFYEFLQQHIENTNDVGNFAREIQPIKPEEITKISAATEKTEHKTWTHIVIDHADNMMLVDGFNHAWVQYSQYQEELKAAAES